MAVSAIGVVASNAATTTNNATVSQQDFLRILLTQLRFQDPLKPVDNQAFIAQLAQFSALEINRQSGEKLDTLLTISGVNQALGLVGHSVEVNSASGSGAGTVTAVSFASGEPRLTVKTATQTLIDVHLSDVILVQQGTMP
jgi:flagellar basal-body rod modification protein FlgD